jgi:hypothetical protein
MNDSPKSNVKREEEKTALCPTCEKILDTLGGLYDDEFCDDCWKRHWGDRPRTSTRPLKGKPN